MAGILFLSPSAALGCSLCHTERGQGWAWPPLRGLSLPVSCPLAGALAFFMLGVGSEDGQLGPSGWGGKLCDLPTYISCTCRLPLIPPLSADPPCPSILPSQRPGRCGGSGLSPRLGDHLGEMVSTVWEGRRAGSGKRGRAWARAGVGNPRRSFRG